MKQTIILHTPQLAARACAIIQGLSGAEVVHEVVIREHKANRSAAQNSLMWRWLTIIGAELGESKEALHERYKERFLVPIYERDDAEYAQMIEAVRTVWRGGQIREAQVLKRQIVALTSTTKADTAQMSEYLTDIERDAASLGIRLPHPDDIYFEAMGRAA